MQKLLILNANVHDANIIFKSMQKDLSREMYIQS